ncbi:MAG: hypothetical protein U0P45_17225 [Acidimicrobiales bacterium]
MRLPPTPSPVTGRRPDPWPALDAIVARVAAELSSPPVLICSHLADGAPVAVACAQHPAAGLMCGDCALAHTERHAWAVEHVGDGCEADDAEVGFACPIPTLSGTTATMHPTRGAGFLVGRVRLIGLGFCPSCTPSGVAA